MKTTFDLDHSFRLDIGDNFDRPNIANTPPAVHLTLIRLPLPMGPRASSYPAQAPNSKPIDMTTAVFYGPYPCSWCGCQVVEARQGDDVYAYDAPSGPIYPNTEWYRHAHRDAPVEAESAVFGTALKPSYARAIASAMLSAATEARNS